MPRWLSTTSTLLEQSIVKTAKPRKRIRTIWDTELTGYALKIWPCGRKAWYLAFRHKRKMFRRTIGDATKMPEAEARQIAFGIVKDVKTGIRAKPLPTVPTFEEAGYYLLERYSRHWKPVTKQTSERCFQSYILPYFRGRHIDAITRADVLEWFASMSDKPGAANRCLPLLSVLMEQAERYGYRRDDSNPCRHIRRYRLKARERFLTDAEMRHFGEVLREYGKKHKVAVAMIRLLMLTGCRKSEMLNLQWSFYREGHLYLPDSKTGPKVILLSSPARQILDSLPRRGRFVFAKGPRNKPFADLHFWYTLRKEAGLGNVRLHDLRHSYASFAIRHGVALGTVGRLLGHQDTDTTLQYIHLCDDNLRQSAQIIGDIVGLGRRA